MKKTAQNKPVASSRITPGRAEWVLFGLFALTLGIVKFGFHELWKDEWQAWLISASGSLREIFSAISDEGHPSLWYIYLYLVHSITSFCCPGLPHEHVLGAAHYLLVIFSFYLIILRLPIPILFKAGITGSYFFFFEYGVVNRGYILIVMLLLLWLLINNYEKKQPLKIAAILFFLCQTEVYGAFIAASLTLYYLLEYKKNNFSRDNLIVILCGGALGALFFLLSITNFFSKETSDETFKQLNNYTLEYIFTSFQAMLANGFLPGLIPSVKGASISFSGIILSVILLFFLINSLKNDRSLMYSFIFFLMILYFFMNVIYVGNLRHWGLGQVFFLVLFIKGYLSGTIHLNKLNRYFLAALLGVNMIFNGYMIWKEQRYLYSNSKDAGRYIREKIIPSAPVVAINDTYATPVIGYSGHPFYTMPEGTLFTYFNWEKKMFIPAPADLTKFKKRNNFNKLYVISYRKLNLSVYRNLFPVRFFDQPSIKGESYYLYQHR